MWNKNTVKSIYCWIKYVKTILIMSHNGTASVNLITMKTNTSLSNTTIFKNTKSATCSPYGYAIVTMYIRIKKLKFYDSQY